MPPRSRAAQGFAGAAVKIDLILKGSLTPQTPASGPTPRSAHALFSLQASHHLRFRSGRTVLLAAALPDTPERGRQQAEPSRTRGRCDRKAFGATGCMAGKDTIDK